MCFKHNGRLLILVVTVLYSGMDSRQRDQCNRDHTALCYSPQSHYCTVQVVSSFDFFVKKVLRFSFIEKRMMMDPLIVSSSLQVIALDDDDTHDAPLPTVQQGKEQEQHHHQSTNTSGRIVIQSSRSNSSRSSKSACDDDEHDAHAPAAHSAGVDNKNNNKTKSGDDDDDDHDRLHVSSSCRSSDDDKDDKDNDDPLKSLHPPPTCMENSRDALLRFLDHAFFQYLGIAVLLGVIVSGAIFFFFLMGWQTLCSIPSKTDCQPRNDIYNVAIQVLTAFFTYMATFSMPWRCVNFLHTVGWHCPSCCGNAPGHDLYGLPTDDVWFHIPTRPRIVILVLLLWNCLFQYANQVSRILFYNYTLQDEFPGTLWTNLFFVSSMACATASGGTGSWPIIWPPYALPIRNALDSDRSIGARNCGMSMSVAENRDNNDERRRMPATRRALIAIAAAVIAVLDKTTTLQSRTWKQCGNDKRTTWRVMNGRP